MQDGIEFEKKGRPAVTVITHAFMHAAQLRSQALGLTEHPVVVIGHPIASKNADQIKAEAQEKSMEIVEGLVHFGESV